MEHIQQKMIINRVSDLKILHVVVLFRKQLFRVFMENTVLLKSMNNAVNYFVMG